MTTEDFKYMVDAGAISTGIATFFDELPHVAALLTVIWIGLRIYESRTVQSWIKGKPIPHTREGEEDDDLDMD